MHENSDSKDNGHKDVSQKFNFTSAVLACLKFFLQILLIVFFLRAFIFEMYRVSSGSMKPTILVGDRLLVLKYSYGYGNHFFFFSQKSILSLKKRFLQFSQPKRGDVVVFRRDFEKTSDEILYVKRLIGLPGDTVQVIDGVVHVNGDALSLKCPRYTDNIEQEVGLTIQECDESFRSIGVQSEAYKVRNDYNYMGFPNNTKKYVVPEGFYFFLGDNRLRSKDSRYEIGMGMIRDVDIVGKVKVIFSKNFSENRFL